MDKSEIVLLTAEEQQHLIDTEVERSHRMMLHLQRLRNRSRELWANAQAAIQRSRELLVAHEGILLKTAAFQQQCTNPKPDDK